MEPLLALRSAALAVVAASAVGAVFAESDRHHVTVDVSAALIESSTPLVSWSEGGFSKLAETGDGLSALRLFAAYEGRLTPTLRVHVVADYVDAGASGIDLTEAFVDWRPIPRSRNQQQWRFGAFYPPLSLENGDRGWQSPFTYSYSAINTWLGEEVRPVGAEWSLRHRFEGVGRAQELKAFAAGFYGNDPAGTLLFWRGWALHDRQSRLGDRLDLPKIPLGDAQGTLVPQPLTPFEELDHRLGAYAGAEWRYGQRALLQLAHYDNRSDPARYSDGVWGWGTNFSTLATQVSLPGDIGLMAQWLSGETYWISGALPDGTLRPGWSLVEDEFNAQFVMLTRKLGQAHRVALRRDTFEVQRPGFRSDAGHAWTLGYRFEPTERISGGVEWLRVVSRRDLWVFYGLPPRTTEEQVRVQFAYRLDMNRGR